MRRLLIITRTPVRISFFGGGTDYPAYYLRHGGATLATTINKYVYVTVQHLTEYFDHRLQVHYSRVESVKTIDEVRIPNVRETLRLLKIDKGVEIHLVADLPARTGLGTSSATTVGLVKALHGHRGDIVDDCETARQAVEVEQEMMHERVGSQDQYIATFGGFCHLRFLRDGSVYVEAVPMRSERREELRRHLMMFYTGIQRNAHEVVREQLDGTCDGRLDGRLSVMRDQVARAIDILAGDEPITRFGELLHQAWEMKRELSSKISSAWIDGLYRRARNAGSLGGKLLGAGGGGFMLFFVEPRNRSSVREAMAELREVDFDFETQGTRIIYYQP